MASAPYLNKSGQATLDDDAFAAKWNEALVHECVRAELNARRTGTASSRTRGQVRGGGAKPWRQKGTGRARAGSIRSPLWAGGGVVFGPTPRHYTVKVNRKARRRAMRAALSVHAERGSVAIFDASDFDTPSTKSAAQALAKWGAKNPVCIILTGEETGAMKSFRNIPRTHVLEVGATGVADVIGAASIVVSETALKSLEERLAPSDKKEEAAA